MALTVQVNGGRGGGSAGLVVLILLALALAVFAFSGALGTVVEHVVAWLRATGPTTGTTGAKAASVKRGSGGNSTKPPATKQPAGSTFGLSNQMLQNLRAEINRDLGGPGDVPLPGDLPEGVPIP
jgi:hypothetical protein